MIYRTLDKFDDEKRTALWDQSESPQGIGGTSMSKIVWITGASSARPRLGFKDGERRLDRGRVRPAHGAT